MGGRASKQKGDRFERDLVAAAKVHGLDAKRVPLSGACEGYKHDLEVFNGDEKWTVEAKKRGSGFRSIRKWLGTGGEDDPDVLIIGSDREKPLAILHADDFWWLLKRAGKNG